MKEMVGFFVSTQKSYIQLGCWLSKKFDNLFWFYINVLGASNYWIGLDSIGRTGNQWQYSSTGKSKTLMDHGYENLVDENSCAKLGSNSKASDVSCTTTYYSICETNYMVQKNTTKTNITIAKRHE